MIKILLLFRYRSFRSAKINESLIAGIHVSRTKTKVGFVTLQWLTCLIYIDDIIVFGKSFDEHMRRVEEVLERLESAGLKLKPQKSQMLQREVVFL